MQYVQLTLSLPMSLGQELQALANEVGERGSKELAEATLQPVLTAVTDTRKKLSEGLWCDVRSASQGERPDSSRAFCAH